MRHGLGRSLIVLAVFAVSCLAFGLFFADQDSKAGLLGLLRTLHQKPTPVLPVTSDTGFTLAPAKNVLERTPNILVQIDNATDALVESVMPSVVRIDTTRRVDDPLQHEAEKVFDAPYNEPGLGSGVIISQEGHVLTNYHVVVGVDEIIVMTWDGAELLGTPIGSDADMDIALLKIEDPAGRKFTPLPVGDSDRLKPGHTVMAVGSPLGLTNSVTIGVISGRYRQMDETTVSMFMTTAIINPGSSGGPLINSTGELVGINTALVAVDPEKASSWQGIGLATPSNEALNVFYRIMQAGHQTGYLGVTAKDLPATPNTRFGAEPQMAVMITEVKNDSPAEAAGIVPGDFVLAFAGREIHGTNHLFSLVREHAVGQSAPITVFRNGQELQLQIVIASLEEMRSRQSLGTMDPVGRIRGAQDFCEAMGVELGDFTPKMRQQLQILPDSPGILVKAVTKTSQLAGKLQEGDVIERLNDFFIFRSHDFHEKINSIERGVPLTIWFKRGGEDKSVTIKRIE